MMGFILACFATPSGAAGFLISSCKLAAAEKFKECNRAYEVLSDETKRDIYNTQGEEGVEQYER